MIGKRQKGMIITEVWSMDRADRIFSNYIRLRADWKCENCGKNFENNKGQLHNSHFWSRVRMSTRFDPDNCMAVCWHCHFFKLEKEKQGIYRDLMIKRLGNEHYNTLRIKSNTLQNKRESIKEFMALMRVDPLAKMAIRYQDNGIKRRNS